MDGPFSELEAQYNFTSNYSNESPEKAVNTFYLFSMTPQKLFVISIFGALFLAGMLLNGYVIVLYTKNKSMRQGFNQYNFSSAVSDFLVIGFSLPITLSTFMYGTWNYGDKWCKASEFIINFTTSLSIFNLTALSLARSNGIIDPMKNFRRQQASFLTPAKIIAAMWVMTSLLALPSGVLPQIRSVYITEATSSSEICDSFPSAGGIISPRVIVILRFLAYFLIPFLTTVRSNIHAGIHIFRSERCIEQTFKFTASGTQARKKVLVRATKLLIALPLAFLICACPQHAFNMYFYFNPNYEENYSDFWYTYRIYGSLFSYSFSFAKPIILLTVTDVFRKKPIDSLEMNCCLQRSPNITQLRLHASQFNRTFDKLSLNTTMERPNCQLRSNCLEQEAVTISISEDLKEPEGNSSIETAV